MGLQGVKRQSFYGNVQSMLRMVYLARVECSYIMMSFSESPKQ